MDVIYWKSRFESSLTFAVCHLFPVNKAVKTTITAAILKTSTPEALQNTLFSVPPVESAIGAEHIHGNVLTVRS